MTTPSISGFFSGGAKSFSWKDKPLGTVCEGTIKAVYPPQQATDPVDGSPQVSKRTGRPKMQIRMTLQTNERDPQDPEDDGTRDLYIGGWMQGAVGDALRKAGAPNNEPQVGGYLWVQLTERQPNDVPALAPINKFVAQYRLAPVTQGYFNDPTQAQAPQQQYAAPPQVPQQPPYQPPVQQYGINQGLPGLTQPVLPQQQQFVPPAAPGQQFIPSQQPLPPAGPPPQQAVMQPPPQQVQQPEPPKPDAIAQAAWDAMDITTKQAVAATVGGGLIQSPGAPPF